MSTRTEPDWLWDEVAPESAQQRCEMFDESRPFEEWAAQKPNKHISLNMFYMGLKWAQGKIVTELEYDQAVYEMLSTPIGYQVLGVSRKGAK